MADNDDAERDTLRGEGKGYLKTLMNHPKAAQMSDAQQDKGYDIDMSVPRVKGYSRGGKVVSRDEAASDRKDRELDDNEGNRWRGGVLRGATPDYSPESGSGRSDVDYARGGKVPGSKLTSMRKR